MREAASNAGRKLLAIAVLLVAAYVLFKVVIGTLMAVFWVILAVVAVVAVIWALSTLRR
jgi:hypothetical protein